MFKRKHAAVRNRTVTRESDPPRDPAVRRIDSASQYHGAVGEALGRAAAMPGTPQARRLSALIEAVEEYEARHGHDIAENDKLSVSIRRLRATVGIE